MTRWSVELTRLAQTGERAAAPPSPEQVLRAVRRRRAARAAAPAAVAVALVVGGALVIPALLEDSSDPIPSGLAATCGLSVEEAAGTAFVTDDVVEPGAGLADVVAGANRVVEEGSELSIGVEVSHAASGVERYALVELDPGSYVAGWLVSQDVVVGTLAAQATLPTLDPVAPDAPVWLENSFEVRSCAGDVAPAGEYDVVVAVGLTAMFDDDSSSGGTSAVLAEPFPLRIGDADPLAELGACGSEWPENVVSTTDGHELGLRLGASAEGGTVDGDRLRVDVQVSNSGPHELVGSTGHPWLALVRDGIVVGGTDAMDALGIDASLSPDAGAVYTGHAPLTRCSSRGDVADPLPAGDYEVYAIMSFFLESPAGQDGPEGTRTDVTAVGGPWPLDLG